MIQMYFDAMLGLLGLIVDEFGLMIILLVAITIFIYMILNVIFGGKR